VGAGKRRAEGHELGTAGFVEGGRRKEEGGRRKE
jgi:hypothetical protein